MSNLAIRSLFITKEVPYPTKGGVALRNWQNINNLAKYGLVALFSAANWTPKNHDLPQIATWRHCNVEAQRSHWEQFQRRLWWLLPKRHPDVDWTYSAKGAEMLRNLITDFKPNLVIFEQIWLYRYLKVVQGYPCAIILDQHNVEANLLQQGITQSSNWRSRFKTVQSLSHLQSLEADFCRQVDAVWTCSDSDAKLLKTNYGEIAPTYTVPNGLDINYYDSVRLNQIDLPSKLTANPHTIVFVGLLSYGPNTEAATLLLETIYPQVKVHYPNCRLLLVGRNPTPQMEEIAGKEPGIILCGGVADVRPYLAAASVAVVPLRQGGGTRLKILEAFAAGLPVVSTAKGVEGINGREGTHLLIRENPEDIVSGIRQIWSNTALSKKLSMAAYELVKAEYSWEAAGEKIKLALTESLDF